MAASLAEEFVRRARGAGEGSGRIEGLIAGLKESLDRGEDPGDAVAASFAAAKRLGIAPELLAERVVLVHLPRPRPGRGPSPRNRIIAAAGALFSRLGFHDTTVEMVAQEADLAKGTVYRYFKNKDQLFSEVIDAKEEELARAVREAADPKDDLFTAVAKYLAVYFSFVERDLRLYRLITREGPRDAVDPRALLPSKALMSLPGLKHKALRAYQMGLIKGLDFITVFHGIMGLVDGIIQRWLMEGGSFRLMDELDTALNTVFFGLATGKGRALWERDEKLIEAIKEKGRQDGS